MIMLFIISQSQAAKILLYLKSNFGVFQPYISMFLCLSDLLRQLFHGVQPQKRLQWISLYRNTSTKCAQIVNLSVC